MPEGNSKLATKLKRKITLLEENTLEDEPVFKKPLPIDWQEHEDEQEQVVWIEDEIPPQQHNSATSVVKQQSREQEILHVLNNGNLKAITSLVCIGLSRANKIMEYRSEGNTFEQVRHMM